MAEVVEAARYVKRTSYRGWNRLRRAFDALEALNE
jgi:hypothetical protein